MRRIPFQPMWHGAAHDFPPIVLDARLPDHPPLIEKAHPIDPPRSVSWSGRCPEQCAEAVRCCIAIGWIREDKHSPETENSGRRGSVVSWNPARDIACGQIHAEF